MEEIIKEIVKNKDKILENMKHNTENVKKLLLEVIPKINFSQCSCKQPH